MACLVSQQSCRYKFPQETAFLFTFLPVGAAVLFDRTTLNCLLFQIRYLLQMEVGVVQYEARLQRLLHRFLDPSFEVRTDSYLNILLSHLSGNDGKGWYAPCYPLLIAAVAAKVVI